MVQKRSIGLYIFLSIVTCGIFMLYWLTALNDDVITLRQSSETETSGGMVLLFTIITCGIYGLYWSFKMGDKIDQMKAQRGVGSTNTGILYLILAIFGFSIVTYSLIQYEINNMIAADM